MRAWKHILLLFGVLGATAVFAPMLEVTQRGAPTMEFSARTLSFGLRTQHSRIERELAKVEKYLPRSVRVTREDVRLVAEATQWAALAYVPAALMALLGLIGILRRRFGRVLGFFAVLCGLASIGTYLGLRIGIPMALEESNLKQTKIALLLGAHLLVVVGIAGVVAGLGALIKPDRGRPRRAGPPPGNPPPGYPPPGYPPPPGSPPGPPPGYPPPSTPPPVLPPPASA